MPTVVTINGITGLSPFNIYVCDSPPTNCVYVNTIDSVPYEFEVPKIFIKLPEISLKIVDSYGCEIYQNLIL
jgi:hypothetical protein